MNSRIRIYGAIQSTKPNSRKKENKNSAAQQMHGQYKEQTPSTDGKNIKILRQNCGNSKKLIVRTQKKQAKQKNL